MIFIFQLNHAQIFFILQNALESDWNDFEDSVQHEAAQQINADIIVTRNQADYKNSTVRVMTPADFLTFAKA